MSLRSAWLRLRIKQDWQSQLLVASRVRPASGPWVEPRLAERLQALSKNLGLWSLQPQSQQDELQARQMCQRPKFPRVGQVLP